MDRERFPDTAYILALGAIKNNDRLNILIAVKHNS
jgi:hypothetical protein